LSIKSTVQAQKNQNRFPMLISYVQGALGHLVYVWVIDFRTFLYAQNVLAIRPVNVYCIANIPFDTPIQV